jgi:hypothetical protein
MGQNVFIRKEVSVWCSKFKYGRTALSDDPEITGRPTTSYTDEKFDEGRSKSPSS